MKIAILILAHKNPEQLRKLIDILKKDFEVFIHFDKNSDISNQFPNEPHVHITHKRYKTQWGSHNIVLAEIELLRQASEYNCDYYILISGQDFPIVTNSEIISFFAGHNIDYIESCKMPLAYWGMSGGMDRLTLYWETKRDWTFSPVKIVAYIIRELQKIFNIKRKLDFDVYGGSQWFNLTKEAVIYILSFVDNNKSLVRRFRYTRASDEIFFQTILRAFDYKHKSTIENQHFRYVDWQTGPAYPRILTNEDFDKFFNSGNLFARKFDTSIDNAVINKLLNKIG